jgi:hypothetical protein
MLEQNQRSLSLPSASKRDIQSLKNWTEGTSSIARKETDYLNHHDDLLNLGDISDNAITSIETLVEDLTILLGTLCRRVRFCL